jgi:16S rRNA (adenine1518-N6/adenine1519-N6)-dimethyltransferase
MAQTKRDIQALLQAAGINPLKRFGQNFLIDGNLLRKLVAAAEIRPDDVVLEVGPGTGTLTEELLPLAGHVVAVEIDKGMQAICRSRFAAAANFTLLHRDVLARKSQIAPEVLTTLTARQAELGGRMMLVANLPYQVATPLVVELLLGGAVISPLCFTVQAEVADRFLAGPGSKDYGPISIFAQALGGLEKIARVPPEAFWPSPKVDSTMLRIDVEPGRAPAAVRAQLTRVVHACFNHRRKTMRASLRAALDQQQYQALEATGIWNFGNRPEQLGVAQWVELAEWLNRDSGGRHDPGPSSHGRGAGT